jgi:hypothetical protein
MFLSTILISIVIINVDPLIKDKVFGKLCHLKDELKGVRGERGVEGEGTFFHFLNLKNMILKHRKKNCEKIGTNYLDFKTKIFFFRFKQHFL